MSLSIKNSSSDGVCSQRVDHLLTFEVDYTCVHFEYFITLHEKWNSVLEDVQTKFVPALKWESPIPVNVEEAGLMFLGLLIV